MSLSEAPGAASIDDVLANANTLCELFQGTAARAGDDVALRTVGGATELTWRQYAERVEAIAAGLAKLGVGRGDTVAIMMTNRPEFSLVDCAAMHLGATPFSVYNTLPAEDVAYLFSNAGNNVVVFQEAFAGVVREAAAKNGVEHLVCIDAELEGTISLADLEAAPADGFDFEAAWRAVEPDDVLTLIYTSGTTGPSKGVELTHKSMMAELRGMAEVLPLQPKDRTISFLPHAHIADRWATYYSHMVHGGSVTSISDPTQLLPALHEVRPTIWGAVPRIWEKFKAALDAGIAAEEDPQKKAGIEKALEVGHQYQALKRAGQPVPAELEAAHAKLDELVLSQLRAKLGLDQVRWIVVGAAPSPAALLEFFGAIGLPLLELWGMSEISCCAIVNPPEGNRIGTVGKPIPGVEVRAGEDGELQVRGDILMKGYRNQPEKTAETITEDGWLLTGDIVEISDDGYVKIVDRKKELIINAAGKNMSPSNIEAQLKSAHALIGQAIAIGDGRPYNVALLVLDPDAVAVFAQKLGLSGDDATPAAVAQRDDVKAAIAAAVESANEHLARVEQIKRYAILGDEWQPGGVELTPTMKLKRKPINEKYAAEIEALYA
ncbi:AMP-binding protein [Conexibacter sp. W3-3-2]|uniref:AMP-binding protein n=1 Tax=Conexibacter sp. W3-3-2 TaxID=2675227 RepID=UPI0012B92F39|nr:AMP-binding protein [Conexibacter sp. W3-3-2]MTD45943.1 AMP-binding protein [Conexibacter sp. W3-3-2]